MSAVLPYVAPWQSGFERHATQLVPPTLSGTSLRATVPDAQWWRVIFLSALYATSAVAGNRQTLLTITDSLSNVLSQQFGPAAIPASALVVCTWAPWLSTYSNLSDLARGQETVAMPDLMWPSGSTFALAIGNPAAGDGFGTQRTFAVEVYVQERAGRLVPLPAPLVL